MAKAVCVCLTCKQTFATKHGLKNVSKKIYPRKALAKLLWPNVVIKKGSKQLYMNASKQQE